MLTITLFFVSFLATTFLFVNKAREINTGKPFIALSFGSDKTIKNALNHIGETLHNLPKILGGMVVYQVVKWYLKIFEKSKGIIYPRIAHIVDAVKGRDIPKNRGSVSVYWTTIADKGMDNHRV